MLKVCRRLRLTVINKDSAKKEICGWQNTHLTTLTRWHTDTGAKFTIRATGSNEMTALQIMSGLILVGTLRARSKQAIGKDCVNGKRLWYSCKWKRRGNIRNRLRDSRVK